MPNDEGIDLVTAFVVPATDAFDEKALLAPAAEHLAAYKLPKRVLIAEELARTANGNVRRKRLREQVGICGEKTAPIQAVNTLQTN